MAMHATGIKRYIQVSWLCMNIDQHLENIRQDSHSFKLINSHGIHKVFHDCWNPDEHVIISISVTHQKSIHGVVKEHIGRQTHFL